MKKEKEKTRFNSNIKYLLDSQIISVKTLMNITGATESMVSMWRNGKREGTLRDCIKISRFLNISIDELVSDEISKKIKK